MPIIPLDQGSQKWLDYRQGRVMATDSSILTGSNPWKTPLELWEEKLGIREPTKLNDAMKRGQELEPKARELANEILSMTFEPCVYESDLHYWMAASLDGLSECRKYILEIKCPKESTHFDAIQGRVPSYYLDQMHHQMAVVRADLCFYFSYRPENEENPYAIVEVRSDPEKQEEIISRGYDFYMQMCTSSPPIIKTLKLKGC